MSLIINKISSSSLQVDYSYLESDLLFGYNVVASYSLDFSDVTYTNEQNILFEGIEALRQAYQQKNLVARIGGDEFLNGRLTSQSFEESALVGNSSCSITIEESKRLDDYSSHEFAQHIPSPQWIESFSESFSFSRTGDSYSSSRNVSLKYKQDAGNQFLNNAKLFLRNVYFNSRPNLGYHVDGISENGRFDGGFRPLISETVDLLGLSVSIVENLDSSFIVDDYSKRQTYSEEVDAGGYLQKKYAVEIKALKEPLESVADSTCKVVLDAIITDNSAQFGYPIEIGKGINKDGGEITLNVSFTNNPALNQATSTTYSVSKTRRQSFYDYGLAMEILSDGQNEIAKANNAKTYWLANLSTYETKVQSLFPEADPIYEMSRQTSFQTKDGKISDNVVFTDDPAYNSAALPEGLLKLKFSNSLTPQIDRIRTFIDLSDKREKIELSDLLTIGNGSFTMEAVAFKSLGMFYAADYLASLSFSIGETIYENSDTLTISSEGSSSRVIGYDFV